MRGKKVDITREQPWVPITVALIAAAGAIVAGCLGEWLKSLGQDRTLAQIPRLELGGEGSGWAFGYTPEKLLAYNQLIEDNWIGIAYAKQGKLDDAEVFYNSLAERLASAEASRGERFHKGLPFHNLACVALLKGKLGVAATDFMRAYGEDYLTAGLVARGWMAAQGLREIGVPVGWLKDIENILQNPKASPEEAANQLAAKLQNVTLKEVPREMAIALMSPESYQNLAAALSGQVRLLDRKLTVQYWLTYGSFVMWIFVLAFGVWHWRSVRRSTLLAKQGIN